MTRTTSPAATAYLEAIYRLQEISGLARTSKLAVQMGVAAPSATGIVRKLEREGLVIHEPYRGVKLTDQGRMVALSAISKHRLAERLLVDMLHMDWTRVHGEACRLQYGISNEIVRPLEKALGHPRTCPHGNPIPTKCGGIVEEESDSMTNLRARESGVVVKLTNEQPEVLEHLAKIGLRPGVAIEVREPIPKDEVAIVSGDGENHRLPWEVASTIKVKRTRPESEPEHLGIGRHKNRAYVFSPAIPV